MFEIVLFKAHPSLLRQVEAYNENFGLRFERMQICEKSVMEIQSTEVTEPVDSHITKNRTEPSLWILYRSLSAFACVL